MLAELIDAAEVIPITDEIVEAARLRVDKGNPPGKRGSLGDALNWEALLTACEDGEDLFLVTGEAERGAVAREALELYEQKRNLAAARTTRALLDELLHAKASTRV